VSVASSRYNASLRRLVDLFSVALNETPKAAKPVLVRGVAVCGVSTI
jgi:hypothetical protein